MRHESIVSHIATGCAAHNDAAEEPTPLFCPEVHSYERACALAALGGFVLLRNNGMDDRNFLSCGMFTRGIDVMHEG